MKYEPQLATLVKTPPSGADWIHEIKFDGYRIGCHVRGDRVTLTSRNGKDWTAAFPEIVDAARSLKAGQVLLDGEVAAMLPDGRTSFQAMQQRGGMGATIVYFVFDLPYADGHDLRPAVRAVVRVRRDPPREDHPARLLAFGVEPDDGGLGRAVAAHGQAVEGVFRRGVGKR